MTKTKKKMDRTTIPGILTNLTDAMKKEVDTFMFDYGFMFRYAFKRYIEIENYSLDTKEIQKHIQELEKELAKRTGYPIRVAKDAVADAVQLVKARHALMKEYLNLWLERFQNSTQKYEKLVTIPTINQNSRKIQALRNKMVRQQKEIAFYQKHVESDTFPAIVFGGKKNFEALQKGKLSKEKWHELRNGRVSSRGDATLCGNPNIRVLEKEEGFFLQMTSNRNISKGEKPIYDKTTIPLYIATKRDKKIGKLKGRKYPEMMKRVLEDGSAYEVEILKRNGNYYVHIVVKNDIPPVHKEIDGLLAIDTNIDGLALCHLNMQGKPLHFEWLGDGGLQYYSSFKRENKIWEMAHYVVNYSLKHNLGVVVEDLEQMHNREIGKRLRRKVHQFCYKKLLQCIEALCIRYGICFIKVKPQYTSVIGRLKYQTKYRVNVHLSAAMVIGRRSLKIKEQVPLKLQSLLTKKQQKTFEEQNEWKQWSMIKKRVESLLKKRKAKFYQWHDQKKDVFQTLNKTKSKKKQLNLI